MPMPVCFEKLAASFVDFLVEDHDASFIKKGNVFVINGEKLHAYKDPYDFKICNIMFKPEMLKSAGPDLRALNGFQALFILEPLYRSIRPYKSKLNTPIPSLEYVSSLIAAMIDEHHSKLLKFVNSLRLPLSSKRAGYRKTKSTP